VAPSHTPVAVLRIPVVRNEIEARGGIYAYLWLERKVAAPPAPVRAPMAPNGVVSDSRLPRGAPRKVGAPSDTGSSSGKGIDRLPWGCRSQ
jgi:hypothetical protein